MDVDVLLFLMGNCGDVVLEGVCAKFIDVSFGPTCCKLALTLFDVFAFFFTVGRDDDELEGEKIRTSAVDRCPLRLSKFLNGCLPFIFLVLSLALVAEGKGMLSIELFISCLYGGFRASMLLKSSALKIEEKKQGSGENEWDILVSVIDSGASSAAGKDLMDGDSIGALLLRSIFFFGCATTPTFEDVVQLLDVGPAEGKELERKVISLIPSLPNSG